MGEATVGKHAPTRNSWPLIGAPKETKTVTVSVDDDTCSAI